MYGYVPYSVQHEPGLLLPVDLPTVAIGYRAKLSIFRVLLWQRAGKTSTAEPRHVIRPANFHGLGKSLCPALLAFGERELLLHVQSQL